MKNYSEMSNQEIALRVAKLHEKYEDIVFNEGDYVELGDGANWRKFDPCNNPSDAWLIITDNKISTMWMTAEKEWCAWTSGDLLHGCWEWDTVPDYYCNHENNLRAAMIVFLMMKDAGNENIVN